MAADKGMLKLGFLYEVTSYLRLFSDEMSLKVPDRFLNLSRVGSPLLWPS